jgi:hypothetical protein
LLYAGFLCVHLGLIMDSNERSLVVVWRVSSFESFNPVRAPSITR